jgi:hypothetical protein
VAARPYYLEGAHEVFTDAHDGPRIIKLAAIVWGRKDGDELAVALELVPVLHDLVCAADEIEVVLVQETLNHVGAKRVRDAPVYMRGGEMRRGEGRRGEKTEVSFCLARRGEALIVAALTRTKTPRKERGGGERRWRGDKPLIVSPARDLGVGVGPEHVAQEPLVGHVGGSGNVKDDAQVVLQVWGQAAMHTQNFLCHNRRYRHAVEAIGKNAPQLDAVPPLALVVKAVYSVERGALVISAQKEKRLRVLDFVAESQSNHLDALLGAIHIIAEKQIIRVGRKPSNLKKTQQICVLAVCVSTNVERG